MMQQRPLDLVVLDGGLSTALEEVGADLRTSLWTARLLRDDPDAIVAAHAAYFAAGACVATTASYQASLATLPASLITSCVTLAQRARDEADVDQPDRLLVAASIGPYGAVLADGSEYRGDYGLDATQLRDFHLPRLELLAAAGPDLFAVETIPDVREAEVLVPLLDEIGLPAWLSYTVADGRTRAGQDLEEAFAVVAGSSSIVATGVNCCAPNEVLDAVVIARSGTGLPCVAYPNRGSTWDASTHEWVGGGTFPLDLIPAWLDAGVRLLGGCCEVGPSDIAALARALRH